LLFVVMFSFIYSGVIAGFLENGNRDILQPVKRRTRERSEWSGHAFAGCSKMFGMRR